MGVAVDITGQYQFAPRVDLAPPSRQPATDGSNGLTGDGDIRLEHVARGRDAATANEKIVGGFGHGKLLKS